MIQKLCKVNKQSNGKYCGVDDISLMDIGGAVAGAICARDWKGYSRHGFNLVIEYQETDYDKDENG